MTVLVNRAPGKTTLIIAVIFLAAIGTAGPASAASKIFTVATGLIDNSLDRNAPTSNEGTYAQMWLTPKVTDSTLDSHPHIGDFSIDDTLATLGTIVIDSIGYYYTRDRIYYSTAETLYVWLENVFGGRDWGETTETWTRWKVGSNWSTAGGDTIGVICKVDSLIAHTADTRDTMMIRRGVLGGTAACDSFATATGNTGLMMFAAESSIGADAKMCRCDIYSSEDATDANRPVIEVFYTAAASAGPPPRRRR